MVRTPKAEAFARLLEGEVPAARHAGEALALTSVAAALGKVPGPALPASLAAGRAAFMQAVSAQLASPVASAASSALEGSRTMGTKSGVGKAGVGGKAGVAKAGVGGSAGVAKAGVGGKAGILSLFGAHLAPLAAGTAVVAVGAAGVAVGTSRSLPGDPFYGVKRSVESLQVRTAGGRVATAEEELAQAVTRLNEAAALRQRAGGAAHIPGEVNAWVASETAAVKVLLPLAGQPRIQAELTNFLTSESAGLASMPSASVQAATDALTALAAGLGVTHVSAPTLPATPGPLAPSALLPRSRVGTQAPHQATPPRSTTQPATSGARSATQPATSSAAVTPSRPAKPPAVPATSPPLAKPQPGSSVPAAPTPSVTMPAVAISAPPLAPGAPTITSAVPSDPVGTIGRLLPTGLPAP